MHREVAGRHGGREEWRGCSGEEGQERREGEGEVGGVDGEELGGGCERGRGVVIYFICLFSFVLLYLYFGSERAGLGRRDNFGLSLLFIIVNFGIHISAVFGSNAARSGIWIYGKKKDEWTDGRTDGRMDGWTGWWADTDYLLAWRGGYYIHIIIVSFIYKNDKKGDS
jgi:hypothetical protein